ncbi:hypothetical protein IF2G_03658 [Cordyceps javanica]|nr:hypothetical protein IF2G_03658 [Cordyceps javanica]
MPHDAYTLRASGFTGEWEPSAAAAAAAARSLVSFALPIGLQGHDNGAAALLVMQGGCGQPFFARLQASPDPLPAGAHVHAARFKSPDSGGDDDGNGDGTMATRQVHYIHFT